MGTSTRPSTTPLIRLAHPQAFAAFLQEIGTPTERLFRRVGLPVYCDDPMAFVPLRHAWSLFDAAARLEDPQLGWHVGHFYGDRKLSASFLRKLETAPTLYEALKKLVRMISAEASHLQLGILERPNDILFHTHYSTIKDWPGYEGSQAYQLEVYLDLIRHFVGQHWVPTEIGIETATVPPIVEAHFPGSRIQTNQRVGYIAVPRSCLHMAVRNSGCDVGSEDTVVLARQFDYVDTLRALLRAYLSDGYPSAQKVASLMDTSVRTLARRLSEFGLTYRALVDEVRFDAAKDVLLDTDARIGDVARSVGFDDPAHFSRMFRRIGGLSPREFRIVASGRAE
jgi:AraC-like DNA-binding protein